MGVVVTIIGIGIVIGIVAHGWDVLKGWFRNPGSYPTRPMHYKKHGERNRRV
jgi:hypothetical protein